MARAGAVFESIEIITGNTETLAVEISRQRNSDGAFIIDRMLFLRFLSTHHAKSAS